MPFAVIFDEPVKFALQLLLANQGNYLHVDLFTNDVDPDREDVAADYTLAAYPGYGQLAWHTEPDTTDAQHRGIATPFLAAFHAPSSGGPVNVYGLLIKYYNVAEGIYKPLMAHRFPEAPITLTTGDPDLVRGLAFRDWDAHKDD